MHLIIDCISDLHGHLPQLSNGDLLIIAGDFTASHSISEFVRIMESLLLNYPKYRNYVLICGNHDEFSRQLEEQINRFKLEFNISYLENNGTTINGLKIWGSPWSRWFKEINPKCTSFTCSSEQLNDHWNLIPDDTDILVTHMPPYGILDQNAKGEHLGCPYLLDHVKRIKPKLHVFGHIHEGHGLKVMDGTTFVNASIMDEYYDPTNEPIRIAFQA